MAKQLLHHEKLGTALPSYVDLKLFTSVAILLFLDNALTIYALGTEGFIEGNPFLAPAIAEHGVLVLMAVKAVVLIWLLMAPRFVKSSRTAFKTSALGIMTLYVFIVTWNLYQVTAFHPL